MTRRVAMLRGVNVGGAGKLPMAGFRDLLAGLGCRRVETLIQSGNAVFEAEGEAPDLEAAIRDAVAAAHGFAPETFLRSAAEMALAARDHPFTGAEGKQVHVFFLHGAPQVDWDRLAPLAVPGDAWFLAPGRLTLFLPGGIGRSKLAERLMRLLPPNTARNMNTVAKLAEMAAN